MWPEVCTVILVVDTQREQFSAFQGKENGENRENVNISVSLSQQPQVLPLAGDRRDCGRMSGRHVRSAH